MRSSREPERGMPDWHRIYDEMPVESMPWYNPDLDPDVAKALVGLRISHGALLDLGTGPGTQAFELARLGFTVTGSDVSRTAITLATQRAQRPQGTTARFVVDDVLDTKLDETFDVVVDRGCFHVFDAADHPRYRASLLRLLKPGGLFLLKCFSVAEPGVVGPNRFSPDDLRRIFGGDLSIQSIDETVYYANVSDRSPIKHQPRSLFAIMRRARA